MFNIFILLAVACDSTHRTHFASPLQPWLRERTTMLSHAYFLFSFVSDTVDGPSSPAIATEPRKACMQVQIECSHAPCYSPARSQHKKMNQTFLKFQQLLMVTQG